MAASQPLFLAGTATTTVPGLVTLAGDLSGTATAPTVSRINGITITGTPAAGQAVIAFSPTAAAWATLPGASSTAQRVVTASWSATLTPNGSTTDEFRCIISGATTINVPSGTITDGQEMTLLLIQDGTGSRGITLGTGYAFGTDVASYAPSTTAGASDYVGIKYDATSTKWRVLGISRGY